MVGATQAGVVVGVGESPAALHALRYAVAEARRRVSTLRAVRVWQAGTALHGYDVDQARTVAGADAVLTIRRSFEQAMGGLPKDLDVTLIAVEGAVGAALVAQAPNDHDLLVVGASSRRRWRPLMSTVDQQCVRLASSPVVVVPAPAMARGHATKAIVRAIRREAHRLAAS